MTLASLPETNIVIVNFRTRECKQLSQIVLEPELAFACDRFGRSRLDPLMDDDLLPHCQNTGSFPTFRSA